MISRIQEKERMNEFKILAVITDIIFIPSSLLEVDKNKTEIVGFEDWNGVRDFLEQAARDHGDLIGETIECGFSNNRRHTYAIWEYDPDGEGGDRFYRTTTF